MSFTQNLDNTTLHYQWKYNKLPETIIFINSLGTNLSIWEDVAAKLAGHYNILLFDKRGHGLSNTKPGAVTIETYADDVINLMNTLDIKKAHLVGLSIGGLITYSLASRYVDRFDKLIFSNTGAKIGTADGWNDRIVKLKTDGLVSMSANIIERWLSPDYRANQNSATQGYIRMLEQNNDLGYIQACEAIRDADFTSKLDDIKHESLFIGGSADLGTTPAFVEEHAKALGATRVEIIPNVGHLPCIEAPGVVAEIIIDFIEGELPLFERGMKTRRMVLGDSHVDRAEANKTDFDQDFQTYIVNSAWGSIWSRPHLTKRERSMITIAVLASLGHEEELEMHIRASQNTGTSIEDVKEVLLHIGIYAGVPVTNGAMKTAKKIFANIKSQSNE